MMKPYKFIVASRDKKGVLEKKVIYVNVFCRIFKVMGERSSLNARDLEKFNFYHLSGRRTIPGDTVKALINASKYTYRRKLHGFWQYLVITQFIIFVHILKASITIRTSVVNVK